MTLLIRQGASKGEPRQLTGHVVAAQSGIYFRLLRKSRRPEFAPVSAACASTAFAFDRKLALLLFLNQQPKRQAAYYLLFPFA